MNPFEELNDLKLLAHIEQNSFFQLIQKLWTCVGSYFFVLVHD